MTSWLRNNLWRHSYAILMCLFALFPLYLVVISSFNETGSLQVTSLDRKSTRLNSSHTDISRMPSSA